MIALERRDGRPLRVGHRGAAAHAPENTIRSFRVARETGVDAIEFDLLRLGTGEIVVAHSNDLYEVSHGAAHGTVRDKSVEQLRETCPELPTVADAISYFVDEAPELGVHADVKSASAVVEVGEKLVSAGLRDRAYVTSTHVRSLRALAARGLGIRTGLTFPRALLGVSERGTLAPVAHAALLAARVLLPWSTGALLRASNTSALSLHHSVVTRDAVRRVHRHGAPVIAWTVDDVADLARVVEAGVDAVVTNDPSIFASTLSA